MAKTRKSLLILSFAAFIFFAHGPVSPAQGGSADLRKGGAGDLIRLAASRGGQNSLGLERDLRDALISNPPFSEPAQESVAPAAPAPAPYQSQPSSAPAPAPPVRWKVKSPGAAPPPPPPAQAVVSELLVRGYGMDPSGAIIVLGMDGNFGTIDGSNPVRLIFPPEYGLAPVIVGGGLGPPPRAATPLPRDYAEIAVRTYSIGPSGGITIVGMDGYIQTVYGVNKLKLVFPPEYGLPPVIVAAGAAAPAAGGQAQANDPAANAEAASQVMQGIGTILQNIPRGRR